MDTLDILVRARDNLARPENWTQGSAARDRAGRIVRFDRPSAVAFCSTGAIQRAVGQEIHGEECRAALGALAETLYGARHVRAYSLSEVVRWNDTSDHASILAGFDAAIASARETHE